MRTGIKNLLFACLVLSVKPLFALTLPSVFSDRMVLQQQQQNPVWGKSSPGQKISIQFAEKTYTTVTNERGDWRLFLNPLPAGGPYEMIIKSEQTKVIKDILIGEVWLCSGQSNMQWPLSLTNHSQVEIVSAHFPNIRLMDVPNIGKESPQTNIKTQWTKTTPDTVKDFSALCYFYGRRLHQALDVPIGLIKNSWNGTPIEAWISRKALEESGDFSELLAYWDNEAAKFDPEQHQIKMKAISQWKKNGKTGPVPEASHNVLGGGKRPANIFNGIVNPIAGFGIRGTIWYQGEANRTRGYQYRQLFRLLINSWREIWGQGDFPFFWVQLANYGPENQTPANYSDWAETREAQTMALSLPNTGQAVAIDLGEGRDIHPTNKQEVSQRLVRHALAKVYGFPMTADSPIMVSHKIKDNTVILTFENVSTELNAFDTEEITGFYIAGSNRTFVQAKANILNKNQVAVFADGISSPKAVRYGWEDNPKANLYDKRGLPVTPFRTDDWSLGSIQRKVPKI